MTALVLVPIFAVLLVLAATRAPADSNGKRHLLSGYSIVLASFLLYGLFPAFLLTLRGGEFYWAPGYEADHGFARAVAFTGLALVAFLYGYSIATRSLTSRFKVVSLLSQPSPSSREAPPGPAVPRTPDAIRIAMALIILGLLMRCYVVLELGGVGPTVARLSGAVRSQLALENASPGLAAIATMAGVADVAATWLLVRGIRSGRHARASAMLFMLVLASSYLVSGKRLLLILPILVVLCAIHTYRRPVTYRWTPWIVLLVPALGMITLLVRVFLPAVQADLTIDLDDVDYAQGSVFSFYFNSLEFSSTEMTAVAVGSGDEINAMLGGRVQAFVTTSLVPFTFAIPRVLFPGKPGSYIDMSHGISASIENVDVHFSTVGYASTLVGTSYITGGLLGIVIVFALLGYLVRRYDESHVDLPRTFGRLVGHALVLSILFQFMRQGTLGWTFIVAILQQHGFLLGAFMLRDRATARVPARTAEAFR